MTIAITGASGSLGRATAELLLKTVDPRGVVLTTRRPGNLADLAEAGAEVRHADFADPASLTEARWRRHSSDAASSPARHAS
jgi:NAD(P)H dehydrogenase (quinone)